MTDTQSGKEVVLKVDTVGRVRTPREKQEAILSAYGGSGMTGQQFAAYVGVKYSTLMSWVGKERKGRRGGQETCNKPAAMSWVEATMEAESSGKGDGLHIEIGRGVRLEVFNSRQAALAGEVIRSLEVPC
jgi:hypothetical protein